MVSWKIEQIIHFYPNDFCKKGLSHFGFHDQNGNYFALFHQKHFLGLLDEEGNFKWTIANKSVFNNVPNIQANIQFPMFIDNLPNENLVISNFLNALVYIIDIKLMKTKLIINGKDYGMKDVGNCVVDYEGNIWINEVTGCRIHAFDSNGRLIMTLGSKTPGFQTGTIDFEEARFNWIYDIRRGPSKEIFILDSKNFAVRRLNLVQHKITTIAGTGKAGFTGDGKLASQATFGSNPNAKFDGPISLSIDESGNIYIGDKFNFVVRMISKETNIITTIAGNGTNIDNEHNKLNIVDPFALCLPKISSMDYFNNKLFIPTDLIDEHGDLIVLSKQNLTKKENKKS